MLSTEQPVRSQASRSPLGQSNVLHEVGWFLLRHASALCSPSLMLSSAWSKHYHRENSENNKSQYIQSLPAVCRPYCRAMSLLQSLPKTLNLQRDHNGVKVQGCHAEISELWLKSTTSLIYSGMFCSASVPDKSFVLRACSVHVLQPIVLCDLL